MILRLALPQFDTSVRQARLIEWHKEEGDAVTYGDVICSCAVDSITRHRQKLVPSAFREIQEGRAKHFPTFEETLEVSFGFQVVSSDVGWLRRTCAAQDDTLEVGALLAVLSTEQDESLADPTPDDERPLFRVVADLSTGGIGT